MYVVTQHTILDPAGYAENGQALMTPPEGFRLHAFWPNPDLTNAICLWEGPSGEAVRNLVDSTLGSTSQNLCYEVAAGQAYGLPAAPVTEAAPSS
jgi:hypothetical protein